MAKFRGGKGQSNGIWKFSVQSSHISSISAFHYVVLLKYKGGLPSKQLLIVQGLSAATNEYDLESGFDHRLPPIYRSWIHHFRGEQAGSPNPKQYSLGSFSGPKIVLDNPYLDWMTVSPGVKKTIRRSCTMHFPRSAGAALDSPHPLSVPRRGLKLFGSTSATTRPVVSPSFSSFFVVFKKM